jgi:predicted amidohydrolase
MKVAAVQHDIVWEDPVANFARLAPLIGVAAAAGARLVLMSEMYSTGFSMAPERVAEPAGGPSEQFLVRQASTHGVWVGASVPQRPDGGGRARNTFLLAAPDGQVSRYDKIHPFSYSGEDDHYDAGTETLTVDVEGLRVSPFVCYDLRFADTFWKVTEGTDLYAVVANWPAARRVHWQTLLQARAIENQAYVVGVNRVGTGDDLDYAGDSRVVDPMGEVLAAAAATETVLVVDVDPGFVASTRARYPFMADR